MKDAGRQPGAALAQNRVGLDELGRGDPALTLDFGQLLPVLDDRAHARAHGALEAAAGVAGRHQQAADEREPAFLAGVQARFAGLRAQEEQSIRDVRSRLCAAVRYMHAAQSKLMSEAAGLSEAGADELQAARDALGGFTPEAEAA